MEESMLMEPVQSLVPVKDIQPFSNTLNRKYWHIICKAQFVIPMGLTSLRISFFLIMFNSRLFLTITFEIFNMLPPPQEDLEFPIDPPLSNQAENESIPLPCGPIPVGYGVFEVPECLSSFLNSQNNMEMPDSK